MTQPAPSRGYRASVVIREILLWLGSVVGVLCLVVAGAAVFFGVTPLIFRSGSMSPQIPTGALALARSTPATDLSPGDVVSVIRADGERVTHRLVSEKPTGDGRFSLVVKGDANKGADPEPVITRSVDRVFWSTPRLGYVLEALSKPQVVFPLGALFGMLAVIGFRPPLDKRLLRDPEEWSDTGDGPDGDAAGDTEKGTANADDGTDTARQDPAVAPAPTQAGTGRHLLDDGPAWTTDALGSAYDARRQTAKTVLRGGALALTALVVLSASTLGLRTTSTLAAFADTGRATGSFAAGKVPAPATFTCTIVSGQVRFDWTVPASTWAPTSYTLTNTGNGTVTTISPGTTHTVTVSAPVVSLGGLTNFVYTITSNLGTSSSQATQTRTVVALLGLLPTCS